MIESYARDTPPDKIMAALERDGAVIVHAFLAPASVERLNRELGPYVAAADWCNTDSQVPNDFFGRKTKRFHGLLGRAPALGEVICDPLLLSMCDHFLKPHCNDYRLSTGELMVLGDGQGEQLLHRDSDSWGHFPEPRPEILVSANIALTDFTGSNGATVLVPGSHRWPREREATASERVAALMPRGSALLFLGNTLHGGGANSTRDPRIGLYLGYIYSWLRPLENALITNGEAALRAAPRRTQTLLDYTRHGWQAFA